MKRTRHTPEQVIRKLREAEGLRTRSGRELSPQFAFFRRGNGRSDDPLTVEHMFDSQLLAPCS